MNHDSEDWDNLVDLGEDELGDHVIVNREVFEADLAIAVGHTMGNPYGGYSGGYKHVATGITHWRTIAAHHVPHVMHRDDFTPVSSHSLMRKKFAAARRILDRRPVGTEPTSPIDILADHVNLWMDERTFSSPTAQAPPGGTHRDCRDVWPGGARGACQPLHRRG